MSEHVKSDLPTYLSGALSERRRNEIEAHLAECEACRHAADRLKARQARARRQALKDAATDRVPNLLLTRLGRQAGVHEPPRRGAWVWIVLVIGVVLAGLLWFGREYQGGPAPAAGPDGVTGSTESVAGTEIRLSTPTAQPSGNEASPALRETSTVGQQWSGADSAIREARAVVIRQGPAWRALWAEMQQPGPAPRLDFDQVLVAAFFAGPQPSAGAQVVLDAPVDRAEDVAVPFRIAESGSGSAPAAGPAHPWAMRVLARTPKRVRFIPLH